jgi:putative hemolysin
VNVVVYNAIPDAAKVFLSSFFYCCINIAHYLSRLYEKCPDFFFKGKDCNNLNYSSKHLIWALVSNVYGPVVQPGMNDDFTVAVSAHAAFACKPKPGEAEVAGPNPARSTIQNCYLTKI